jgi:hypothetical protein
LPLAVATYICDEVLRDLASFKVINIRRFEESDAFAGLGGAVELNEGQVEVPARNRPALSLPAPGPTPFVLEEPFRGTP